MNRFLHEYRPEGVLRVFGEDAADFLQSQFSNDLRPFERGRTSYGLFLDAKGKVQADGFAICEDEESFLVVSVSSPSEVIKACLERHIVADDVEIEVFEGADAVLLGGGDLGEVMELFGVREPSAAGLFEGGVAFSGRRSGGASVELVAWSEIGREEIRSSTASLRAQNVSINWIQKERLDAMSPSVPDELGPSDLPGEGGLVEEAVSLTKGCFIGQEVVARMHNVGRPRRGLFRVRGEGLPPQVGETVLTREGSDAGAIRSIVPLGAGWMGAAMLKLARLDDSPLRLGTGESVVLDRPFLGGENRK